MSLVGPGERTRAMAVDLVTELTTFCAPDDLLLAVCHPKEVEDWEFVKWLPHARIGDSVLVLPDGDGFGELLAEDIERRRDQARRRTSPFTEQPADESRRRLLVIVDGYGAASPMRPPGHPGRTGRTRFRAGGQRRLLRRGSAR